MNHESSIKERYEEAKMYGKGVGGFLLKVIDNFYALLVA